MDPKGHTFSVALFWAKFLLIHSCEGSVCQVDTNGHTFCVALFWIPKFVSWLLAKFILLVIIVFADFWRYPMSFSVGENADSSPSKSKMGEGAAVNSVASTALPDVLPAGEKHTPGSSKKILLLLYTFGQNLVSCSQLENPRFRQYVLWFLQAHTWNLM